MCAGNGHRVAPEGFLNVRNPSMKIWILTSEADAYRNRYLWYGTQQGSLLNWNQHELFLKVKPLKDKNLCEHTYI